MTAIYYFLIHPTLFYFFTCLFNGIITENEYLSIALNPPILTLFKLYWLTIYSDLPFTPLPYVPTGITGSN